MANFLGSFCFTFICLFLLSNFERVLSRTFDSSNDNHEFWKQSIVYQIYPRSFYDTNEDGIGDLKGIASKTNYFTDIGVETIWLSPIYKSPMADFGYDVSNFVDVDPIFGNMEDFDILIQEMHNRNIKVILDFVPNHSSDKHEWFQKSLQNDPKYKDYYIWKDPLGTNQSGDPIPPNNWLNAFRGSGWEWSEERCQFYFHQYLKEQPDLNYRNTDVVEEMKNVLRFWLDKGVDGFRMDAVTHLVEIDDVYGMDEPVASNSGISDPTQYNYLNHTYTVNQPETFTVINGWKKVLDEYPDKLMILEVFDKNLKQVMQYYGNNTFLISDFPFNFFLVNNIKERKALTGQSLRNIVDMWLTNMSEGRWPNWVLGNHDNNRVSSRWGSDIVDAMNMFTLLLPGTPITYYGEEIGMEDTFISFEDTQDPSGCNQGPDNYLETSRDPARTPMQWDDSAFSGFTEGNKTWLTVNKDYLTVNVKTEGEVKQSHLKVYKLLAQLRRKDVFKLGASDFLVATEDALAFIRSLENEEKYILVINTSEEANTIDISKGNIKLPETGTVVIRSSTDSRPETEIGNSLNLGEISLVGGEGIVLKLKEE